MNLGPVRDNTTHHIQCQYRVHQEGQETPQHRY